MYEARKHLYEIKKVILLLTLFKTGRMLKLLIKIKRTSFFLTNVSIIMSFKEKCSILISNLDN